MVPLLVFLISVVLVSLIEFVDDKQNLECNSPGLLLVLCHPDTSSSHTSCFRLVRRDSLKRQLSFTWESRLQDGKADTYTANQAYKKTNQETK